MGDELFAAFILLCGIPQSCTTLRCWKCIAHDCDYSPEENYKASKVSCDEGQQCMKVHYKMFDNITYYDSVIRTCTAGPFQNTAPHEFQDCIATPKLYMISGCSLRSCCADRDLCNSGKKEHPITYYVVLLTIFNMTFLSFQSVA